MKGKGCWIEGGREALKAPPQEVKESKRWKGSEKGFSLVRKGRENRKQGKGQSKPLEIN